MQLSPEDLAVLDQHRPHLAHRWSEPKGHVLVYAVLDHGADPALGEVLVGSSASPADTLERACRLARSFSIRAGLLGVARGGAAVIVVADPQLDREQCVQLLGDRLDAAPLRVLAGSGLHDTAERLGTHACHQPERLARLRAQVLEACLRPVLPRLAGLSAVVLGAEPRGRDLAAALQQRGVEVSLWDPDPSAARSMAETLGVRTLDGPWIDAEVDLLVPCGSEPVIDGAAAAERLGARVVCGAAPRVFATAEARNAFEARDRWHVPELLAAAAEPLVLGLAEGLLDEAAALASIEQTAREVLTSPRGAHERAITLAVTRSKAAQSRPRTA